MEAQTASSAAGNPPLFEEPQQQQPEPMFREPTAQVASIPHSDEQIKTTASLAALASQRNKESDESLHSTIQRMQEIINEGNETLVRQGVAQDAQSKQVVNIQKEQQQLMSLPFLDGTKMKDLLVKEASVKTLGLDNNAVEKEGVAELQDIGSQDPKQAAIMKRQAQQGSLDWSRENVTKLAIFNNAVDGLQQQINKEPLGSKVLDMLSLPFQSEWARRHALPGTGGVLPSTNLAREVQQLWSLPLPQFEEELPKMVDRIRANSGALWPNLGVAVQTLQSLRGTAQDAFSANVWGAIDLASVVPIGKVAKLAKSPAGLMRGVFNRTAAVDTTAADIMRDMHGVPEAVGGVGRVHNNPEVIANSLPGVSTSSLVNASPGLAGDIAEKINRLHEAAEEVQARLNLSTSRMSPAQYQEAIDKTEKEMALRLKNDHVLDVREAKITELPSVNLTAKAEDFVAWRNAVNKPAELREVIPDDLSSIEGEAVHQSSEAEWSEFTDRLLNFQEKAEKAVIKQKAADFLAWREAMGRQATEGEVTPAGLDPFELEAVHQSSMGEVEAFEKSLIEKTTDQQYNKALNNTPKPATRIIRVLPPGVFEHGVDNKTGLRTISAYLGDIAGDGGYTDFGSALEGILQRGWRPEDVDIVQLDGQYVIKVSQVVPESSIMTPELDPERLPQNWQTGVFLKNANDMLHEYFAGPMVKQTHVKAGLKEQVVKPLLRNISNLSRGSRKALKAIIDLGQKEPNKASQSGFGRWYNVNEFNSQFQRIKGRGATEKEILAYYSYKELNDIDFAIRNDTLYVDKARRGLQTVTASNPNLDFKLPRMNGRIIESPDFNELRVFDAEEGQSYKEATHSTEFRDKFATGNYRVIELETSYTGFGKDPIKYVLTHKENSTVGPLARQQLDYVPGGHRMYNNKWYVKQAVKGRFADGGEYYLDPMTHSNHRTYTKASTFASNQEDARLLYKAIRDNKSELTDEDRQVFARSSAGSFEKFHQLVQQGAVQPDTPFEAVFDRGLPTEMGKNPIAMRWIDPDIPAYEKEMITRGRMYYSPKGEHLKDEEEQLAPVIDPFKTLDRSLRNAIQTKAFFDYNTKVVEEWNRMAFPYLNLDGLGSNRSAQNAFVKGELKKGMRGTPEGASIYQALEQMRTIHKRLLNYKTSEMAQQDMAARRFASFMEGKSDWLAGKGYDWADASPLQAFRGWVFDSMIGMFNPVRLWLHATTAMAAQTIHPVYGFHAGMMSPILKMLEMNRNESVLDAVAGWGKIVTGFEKDDFKAMFRGWDSSSWGSVSGDYGMIDHYPLLQAAESLRDKGRIFFRTAEKYNRMVGWQIAWRKISDEFPELAKDSEEFINKVHLATDDLTNNQTAASRAGWQTGLMSIPTQFHQFSGRLLERMLPKGLGGNSRLTSGERFRLVAGQALMYGGAGVPGAGAILAYAQSQYQQATGQPLDDATWRTLSKGMWDSLIFGFSGGKLDTAIAERAGTGHDWDRLIGEMANGRMSSVLQFVGGPTLEMAGNLWDTTQKVALYYRAQQLDQLTPEEVGLISVDLLSTIQTFSMAQKEYWMLKTGWLVNPKDGGAVVPVNVQDEWAVALGIPLRIERQRGEELQDRAARNDFVHTMGQKLTMFDRNYYRAVMANDQQAMQYWSRMATGLMQPFHSDPYMTQEIMQEAFRMTKQNGPEYETLLQSIERHTGQIPAGENH